MYVHMNVINYSKGYDGELCQNDADGCDIISCLEGPDNSAMTTLHHLLEQNVLVLRAIPLVMIQNVLVSKLQLYDNNPKWILQSIITLLATDINY